MTAPMPPIPPDDAGEGALDAPETVAERDMMDALREELDITHPAHSVELEPTDGSFNSEALHDMGVIENGEDEELPSLREAVGAGDSKEPNARRAMQALYGDDFPLAKSEDPSPEDWASWATTLFSRHSSGVLTREHFARRNRLMRVGSQWISAVGVGPWREPPKPKEAARIVDNMIGPALDQRVEIVSEQRPGFKTRPSNQEQRNIKKAEAQQVALEYEYDQQELAKVIRELSYNAGTDGVAFGCLYWDTNRGPWDESDPNGERKPLGDLCTKVYTIEQVRVSANATASVRPTYWVTRETVPLAQMVDEYGDGVLDSDVRTGGGDDVDRGPASRWGSYMPDREELLRDQPTVERYTVYCEKSEFLKAGLLLVVVGRMPVAGPMPLPWGVVPLFRYTDGSTDPAFYPRPIMEDWIDPQMRVNALKSAWVDSVRLNKGQKLLGKENAIVGETLVGGTHTVISVKGPHPLNETVRELQSFSIGSDVKELLQLEKAAFEEKSGWNAASRGSSQGDQSGRAMLAQREMLERVFAPGVNAAAEAIAHWGRIVINALRYHFDEPRLVSIEGAGRPDLVRELKADDFDGIANVTVDPETLMPMPRPLRMLLLDTMLDKQAISMQEYRRRQPFAFVQNLDTPDTDQYARAKRCAEAIRTSYDPQSGMANPQALAILWMDDEAIHQDVLQRELILPDDLPQGIRSAAYERWMMLAQQAAAKAGGLPPEPPMDGGAPSGAGGEGSPGADAFQGTNPAAAAGARAMIGGASSEDTAARQFDATQQQ